jgi:sialate O-acetylesterase
MVLQRDTAVPVWGRGDPGEPVTINFNGQTVTAIADADGKWLAKLAPMVAGGPFSMTITGKNTILLEDVLIGEVWFCSGQSNMAFRLDSVTDASGEVAQANHPLIRHFETSRIVAASPQFTVSGSWNVCRPETAKAMSAVAYYFGRKLQQDLDNVPVGLIHSSWGGTGAEVWVPKEVLERDADFKAILESWNELVAEYPQVKKVVDEARKQGKFRSKVEPKGAPRSRDTPSGGYYGMVVPHLPFAVRGVIWYQGEGNAGRAHQYRKLFPALIRSWREAWGRPELPFLFVQLPNIDRKKPPQPPEWPELREAQLMTVKSVSGTAMAVTIDVGDPHNLHPADKKPVGERLALAAEGMVYRKGNPDYCGPLYQEASFDGGKAVIRFAFSADGLEAKGGSGLKGFVLAGADKVFVPAEAVIEKGQVSVSSPQVPEPVAVRYAWADNPDANLYNKTGLPASPFRTDDWPERTMGRNKITQTSAVRVLLESGESGEGKAEDAE